VEVGDAKHTKRGVAVLLLIVAGFVGFLTIAVVVGQWWIDPRPDPDPPMREVVPVAIVADVAVVAAVVWLIASRHGRRRADQRDQQGRTVARYDSWS
jgi:hypothetical protein